MGLILASSLVTNALANSGLSTPSLFPFSHISLSFVYNCVTGCSIQVILYHSVLYLRVIHSQFPLNIFSKPCFPCVDFFIFREFSGPNGFPFTVFPITVFLKYLTDTPANPDLTMVSSLETDQPANFDLIIVSSLET